MPPKVHERAIGLMPGTTIAADAPPVSVNVLWAGSEPTASVSV